MSGITKREFLRISGIFCGGLLLDFSATHALSAGKQNERETHWDSLFLTVHPDNSVVLKLPKFDMGQGVATGFGMIFADEMGLSFEQLRVEHADIDPRFGDTFQGVSGGSGSVQDCFTMLREVAAKSRDLFINAAAEVWKIPESECRLVKSYVYRTGTANRMSLGELIPLVAQTQEPAQANLKQSKDFEYVGKPLRKISGSDIVRGKMRYSIDLMVPGMLYASIERCPFFMGSIKSYDDSEARKVQGVSDIFPIPGVVGDAYSENMSPSYRYNIPAGVVVVANSTWSAFKARKLLQIVWEKGKYGSVTTPGSLYEQIEHIKKDNPPERKAALHHAEELITISETYEVHYQAHALMEPLNAVASCSGDRCEVWAGHQFGKRVKEQAAKLYGFNEEHITVHIVPSGGGFGRRWEADFVLEAIFVSKQVQRPVKLQWTREDEIRHDYFHAFERHEHKVRVRPTGQVVAWECMQYTCDNMPGVFPNHYFHQLRERKVEVSSLDAPLQAGSWRSVATHRKTFSLECLLDSIALKLRKDPIDYRLELLEAVPADDKNREVCERLRNLLLFARNKLASIDQSGLGVALTQLRGYCVTAAEVERKGNGFKIKKITAFVDCGLVINPSLVRGQIEGGIIWALQAVIYGGIMVKDGRVVQSNFNDYRMIRMAEVPEIVIHLVPSDDTPLGVGELGVPGVASALSNAIRSLTGENRKSIPFKDFLP